MRFSLLIGVLLSPSFILADPVDYHEILRQCRSFALVGTQFSADCNVFDTDGNPVMMSPPNQDYQDLARPTIILDNCVGVLGGVFMVRYLWMTRLRFQHVGPSLTLPPGNRSSP